MKNCAMDEDAQLVPDQSVANRVLSTFISAVGENEALTEIARRLRPVLLDSETVNEASLRRAIFGDDA